MIKRIKNIFFILPFVMHTVFAFDGYFGDGLFEPDLGLPTELSEVADYSSGSSISPLSLASAESATEMDKFMAAVGRLPIVEREGSLYKCPISGCETLAKHKPYFDAHLKSHNVGQVACIFCKKELCSLNDADSHRCKCPDCKYVCKQRQGMIKHAQIKHPQLAARLGIAQINEELGDRSFASSLDSSSSSLSPFKDSASNSSSSNSSSLLALTSSALSASTSKRGRSPSSHVREGAEADRDKRLCTPPLQPVSPEQWNSLSHEECWLLDFSVSEALSGQFCDDSSGHSLLTGSDYGGPQNFLAFLGGESTPGDFFVESGGLVPDPSISSLSSFDSSPIESTNAIEAFRAAVNRLPRIEKDGNLYKCPILGCGKLAKKKDHLEAHLSCHKAGFAVCIFCKKELYSQDRAKFHRCKCLFCGAKCNARANTIESMAEHVRERHPHLLVPLKGRSVPEGYVPDLSSSSSSSFDSSSNVPAKTFGAFRAIVKQLPRIEEEEGAYKCPILGCGKLAKKKDHLESHLRCHKAGFAVCIFCKKELYSQDRANFHRCKCPSCETKCNARAKNTIEYMAEHVREQHPQLAEELAIEGLADQSSVGSSSSPSSSSSSKSKRGRSSSSNVREDVEEAVEADRDKRLCTPSSFQPVSPEQWNRSSHELCRPLDFSGSEAFGGQCSDDSSDYSCDEQFDNELFL